MSVKDARPEKNGDEERKYSFRTIAVDDEVEDELSRKNAESEHDEEEEGADE